MNFTQEIKDKWLTALRSGEYKQGRAQLYNDLSNSYCCLGVLGVVCETPIEKLGGGSLSESFTTVPEIFLGYRQLASRLMDMNDGGNMNFPQIADYIEQNIPAEGN